MIWALLALVTAFAVSLYTIPVLIKVLQEKGLTDLPTEERKIHKRPVPTIGWRCHFCGNLFCLWFMVKH
jgi:UDP-N-acetylmuramyl pentapeptide phosphotransferase/UDP-N-acetylglucosamine-1-phosphate transferase